MYENILTVLGNRLTRVSLRLMKVKEMGDVKRET
jgi:hypothetical protein